VSDLAIERGSEAAETTDGYAKGFTEQEMADRIFGVLSGAGIAKFSDVIFVIGHGSSSLNNPHESAYDCGACGGHRGGPNARAFALMANRSGVRKYLAAKGLVIPEECWFVGGYHDTCSDEIVYFDLNKIPDKFSPLVQSAQSSFDRARMFDAHERCRRFENARNFSPMVALRHVEGRAQNLREPRPEYGHSGNSILVVGRRDLTRNLFMDRRAFLVSYDPSTDPDARLLSNLLQAVIPVCSGINLEYYFSYVDNERYGCGTKLPHNVTGLIGVMNGSLSDLRTGLSWQMVEIHEPVRLVTIVESTEEMVEKAFERVPLARKLVENRWIQFGILNSSSPEPIWYEGKARTAHIAQTKTLQEHSTSRAYYTGHLKHLAPALITSRGGAK
jgi:uncharacterized protein YbcC (UPF0753/DUF2309 family)